MEPGHQGVRSTRGICDRARSWSAIRHSSTQTMYIHGSHRLQELLAHTFGGPTRSLREHYIPGPQSMPGVFTPGIVATLQLLSRLHDGGALPKGNVHEGAGLLLFCGYASFDGRAANVKAAPWRAE